MNYWFNGRIIGAAVVLATFGVGCGASEGETTETGDTGTLTEPLNSLCGTFTPQATYTAGVPTELVSKTTQTNGCDGNSFIFDIDGYDAVDYLGVYIAPYVDPTDQATCEATDARCYVWEKSGGTVTFLNNAIKHAVWQGSVLGCDDSLECPVALQGGHDYRFGVSVRRPSGVNQQGLLYEVIRPR